MTKTPEELTSDWKAGKLERGLYWVRFKGKIVIAECTVFGNVSKPFEIEIKTDFMIKISKVLAPVPSYDHFVELTEKIKTLSSENERLLNLQAVKTKEIEELESDSLAKKEGEEIVAELTNENNNLRSLLKECDGCVRCLRAYGVADCNGSNINDLITKIEEIAQKALNNESEE